MKATHQKTAKLLALTIVLVGASVLPGQKSSAKAKLADFDWLAGHWTADIPAGHIDQYWAKPGADGTFGMFRLSAPDKTLVLELFTLRETPDGIEMRVRHFNMDLTPWEKENSIVLKLKSLSKGTAVFENPISNQPKRSTMRRLGPDSFHVKSEIIHADKKTEVIELTLKRAAN
jgi:hypothetical protein